jgi:hypothetical protein
MNTETVSFPYRASTPRVIAIVIVVALLMVAFCYLALTSQHSLRLEGFLLSPHQARIFYWLMTAATSLCLIPAAALVKRSSQPPQMIELGPTAAVVPKASLSGELLTIPYAKISKVELREIRGQKFLVIKSSVGESRVVPAGFTGQRAFADFVAALRQRVRV